MKLPPALAAVLFRLAAASALGVPSHTVWRPAASPACTLTQWVGLSDVTLSYYRPSARGRVIFGDLVPFGKIWRTGANASTQITVNTSFKLGGVALPAGTYALYTIPDPARWTIIVSKNLSLWGADGYNQKDDVARFQAPVETLPEPVETFTIDLGRLRDDSALLSLAWERTRVPIKLEVPAKP